MENLLNFLLNNWLTITISFVIGVIASIIANVITGKIPSFYNKPIKARIKSIKTLKHSLYWSSKDQKAYIDNIVIECKGDHIIISNTNVENYKWKSEFVLIENQLIGNWEQENNNGHIGKGAAYIRLTNEAVKIGLWVGDAEGSSITYGFWLFGVNKKDLINRSNKLLSKGFSSINLMSN